jgi:hypothetical protein
MTVGTSASHALVTQLLEDIAHTEMGMKAARVAVRARGRYVEVVVENALPSGLSWDHPASMLLLRLVRQLIGDFGPRIRAAVSLDQPVGPIAQRVIDLETGAIRLRFLSTLSIARRRTPVSRMGQDATTLRLRIDSPNPN